MPKTGLMDIVGISLGKSLLVDIENDVFIYNSGPSYSVFLIYKHRK